MLTDEELVQRLVEERAIVGLMLGLGFARRAKEGSDRITAIQNEQRRREAERDGETKAPQA